VFYKYQVIQIGGATQVVDLKKRNEHQRFLSDDKNILTVLDGDQVDKGYLRECTGIVFIPFQSIEIEIYNRYNELDSIIPRVNQPINNKSLSDKSKNLFRQLTKKPYNAEPLMSKEKIYEYLSDIDYGNVETFTNDLLSFLNK